MFEPVPQKIDFPAAEKRILEFWREAGIFEKSLAVNKDLPKGYQLKFEDLESKKPSGFGIPASQYQSVIGKTLTRDLEQWDFLTNDDITP